MYLNYYKHIFSKIHIPHHDPCLSKVTHLLKHLTNMYQQIGGGKTIIDTAFV